MFFAREVLSWLKFQTWTLKSSLVEIICFPSEVNDAEVWFATDLRPDAERKKQS